MKASGFNPQQFEQMKTHPGFIAALDQSGGSTPGALGLYGVKESAWSNEAEMFALVHQMRARIITSPSFTGERIIGARKRWASSWPSTNTPFLRKASFGISTHSTNGELNSAKCWRNELSRNSRARQKPISHTIVQRTI